MTREHRRTILVFGALAVYMVLQSIWWAYLLIRKDRELESLIEAFQLRPQYPGAVEGHARKTLLMVLGEGGVFLVLVLIAIVLTYRTIRRELSLARAQRNFLLAVTHELRTPIASAKLQLQTMDRDGLNIEQRGELLHQAVDDLDRLGALTEKVLTALRSAEGRIPLQETLVDLAGLLGDRVAKASGGPHAVHYTGPTHAMIRTDPLAVTSIVDNLVENAIKYGPREGVVELELMILTDRWEIQVCDRGTGVAPEERERIFTLFHRGGPEETRGATGTGLGLYIARQLARRLGGDLYYRDRAGGGSIFAASFPLSA
ncbi:MAG: HAMP domain-containing histidine kinase [Flavobacteriales bacterium]|nr:HAMP domain-containing histidine kinase [Flavobacteriales bacterium]MCB9193391.1 HAMP domain-containing histidine kinase [Flavobacteriales bacterium]